MVKQMEISERKCQVCSKYFSGRRRKYCSKSCSHRAKNLKNRYNITAPEVVAFFRRQSGRCGICDVPVDIHELGFNKHEPAHIDHLHNSDHVRGLLCSSCNTGLGKFRDSRKLLKSAIDYLTKTYKRD